MRTSIFVRFSRVFCVVLGVTLLGLAGCSEDSEKISEPPPVDPCTIEENHCISDEEKMTCQAGYVWRSILDNSDICCLSSSEMIRCQHLDRTLPGDPKSDYRQIDKFSHCTDDQTYEVDCLISADSTVPASCACKRNGVEDKSFTMDREELNSQWNNKTWFFETYCNYLNVYQEGPGLIEKSKSNMRTVPFGCSDERRVKLTQDSLADFASYCIGKALFEVDLLLPGDNGEWYSTNDIYDPRQRRVMRGSFVLLGVEDSNESQIAAYVFLSDGTGVKLNRSEYWFELDSFITECKTIEKTAPVLLTTTDFYETAAMIGTACTVKRGTQLTQPTVTTSDDGNGNYSTMVTAPEIESICGWASGYAKKASVVSLMLK